MRTLSWMVAGALLGVVACATAGEFACSGDADCVLSSTPGICTDGGHCAYPDEECSSGYAYPAQTPGMGGECVPGDAPMTGTSGDDDDDDDDDDVAGTGTSSGGDSSGRDDGGSSGDAESTSSVSTTEDDGSTGVVACEDEIGNDPVTSAGVGGCQGVADSIMVDESDIDWWALIGPELECPAGDYLVDLEGPVENDVEVCLMIGCEEDPPSVMCERGEQVNMGIFAGCCDQSGEASGTFSCGLDGPIDPFVSVTAIASFSCEPYDFTVEML